MHIADLRMPSSKWCYINKNVIYYPYLVSQHIDLVFFDFPARHGGQHRFPSHHHRGPSGPREEPGRSGRLTPQGKQKIKKEKKPQGATVTWSGQTLHFTRSCSKRSSTHRTYNVTWAGAPMSCSVAAGWFALFAACDVVGLEQLRGKKWRIFEATCDFSRAKTCCNAAFVGLSAFQCYPYHCNVANCRTEYKDQRWGLSGCDVTWQLF